MKIYLGTEGLDQTFQKEFRKETKCHKCGSMARIAFVAIEDDESEYICDLHDNNHKEEGYWLHDAASFATYFCKKCFAAVTLWNQA